MSSLSSPVDIEEIFEKAFHEDCVFDDITTKACIEQDRRAKAQIILQEPSVIAGLRFLPKIFSFIDETTYTDVLIQEGTRCETKEILAQIEGPASAILATEQIAVNFLQHLCGIATHCAQYVQEIQDLPCEILDTRKTLSGMRFFQKYACQIAGVKNHRYSLADHVVITQNHLRLIPKKDRIFYAIQKAKQLHPEKMVEVEVQSIEEFHEALDAEPNAILLDHMSLDQIQTCVEITQKRIYLEASGGITLNTLRNYALTGVDGISIGALTHSSQAIDLALRII